VRGGSGVKIVQVCGWYFPDSLGGTEAYVSALAERLRALDHHVIIAAPDPMAHEPRAYMVEGLPVFRYPIPGRPTRAEAQHRSVARGAEQFHRWIRQQQPDVVHFHTFVTGVGPHEIDAARSTGARLIATTHSGALGFLCQRGTMMRWGRELCDGSVTPLKCAACALQHRRVPRPVADAVALVPAPVSSLARHVPGRIGTVLAMPDLISRNLDLQRRMLAQVDAFVVLTEWAQRVVVANDGRGGSVVLNRLGVRATRAQLDEVRARVKRPSRSHVKIAYLGRFDRIKGVHDLARAVQALPANTPLHLEFCGPISNVHELTISNEVKAIVGPDAWVTFAPPVEPAAVFEYLRGVDALCCPSTTLEGGPTVALEAIAVGTPVIATRIGALAEIITDGVNGRLVPPGDWRALSQALAAVARDPRGTLDEWRRRLPPVRTMDDVVQEYLRLYGA
jgi:glycosyltransferase involved in cell wall biosynthesis